VTEGDWPLTSDSALPPRFLFVFFTRRWSPGFKSLKLFGSVPKGFSFLSQRLGGWSVLLGSPVHSNSRQRTFADALVLRGGVLLEL